MKLFIIVICLLLERYGEHFGNLRRFSWFYKWSQFLQIKFPTLSPSFLLAGTMLLPLMILGLIRYSFGSWFWGGLGFVFEGFIFFYCLGPQNLFQLPPEGAPFYSEVYFEKVNRQWFGVVFWYIFLGIWAAVVYRLLDLASGLSRIEPLATKILQYMDWAPARLTALLYVLVGNFQQPYSFLLGNWCTGVEKNQLILGGCGMRAVGQDEHHADYRIEAQQLVWRALILLLVCVALLTLAAWL